MAISQAIKKKVSVSSSKDRHIGKRENVWFPFEENDLMLKAMEIIKADNRSAFIRSAVRSYSKAIIAKAKGE